MTFAGKGARFAKSKHMKVRSRDALTAQAIEVDARTGALGPRLQALVIVIRDGEQRRTRKLAAVVLKPVGSKGAQYSVSHWNKPCPRWLDTEKMTPKAHRTCPPWRDITDTFKAYLSHLLLTLDGHCWDFTLNLRSDIELEAVGKGTAAKRWIADRVNHYLKAALGRKALFWFRIELGEGKHRHMHLHGELACLATEVAAVRRALRKAGGEWAPGKRQFQTHLREDPDTGWPSYVMKYDHAHKSPVLLSLIGSAHTPSWRDDRFFISQELSGRAKALYEDIRGAVSVKTPSWRKAA